MPLDLTLYIENKNYWKGIRDYISDCSDQYNDINIQNATDNDIRLFINARFNALAPGPDTGRRERDSFRHCTQDLMNGARNTITRLNQYRLIYALRFESSDEALREGNNFLLNYLSEPDLSARNLLDFIMIAALKLDLDWLQALKYYNDYKDFLQPPAARDPLETGRTRRLRSEALAFNKGDDLTVFLGEPGHPTENLNHFAVTNNTRYQALFNSFNIRKDNETIIFDDQDGPDGYELEGNKIPREYLYNTIIGLKNMDDTPEINLENALTTEEILRLSEIFPGVFMTFDSFNSLTQRRRNVEITHGIMLLKLLEEINPYFESEQGDDECYEYEIFGDTVNFTVYNEIRDIANIFLRGVGLPVLSDNDAFDRLVKDIHNELSREFPDDDSVTFKSKFFRRLRYYCKTIANM